MKVLMKILNKEPTMKEINNQLKKPDGLIKSMKEKLKRQDLNEYDISEVKEPMPYPVDMLYNWVKNYLQQKAKENEN